MPGVYCVICMECDTTAEDWCALRECGHVFHTHCILNSFEHKRLCPQCRADHSKRKYNDANPPYSRIFFEFSDTPGSQPLPGSGGGGSGGDLAQLVFLQGQLRDRERRVQAVSSQLAEVEARAARAESDLDVARAGLRDRESRLQEKIAEVAREAKQRRQLGSELRNVQAQCKEAQARASLLALAKGSGLEGSALAAEVEALVGLGLVEPPKDFWFRMMADRSAALVAANQRHAREKARLEQRQAELQAEVEQLQAQVAQLKRGLAAARQQQPAAGAATAGAANPHLAEPQRQRGGGPFGSARPLPLRRFGAAGASSAAAAAAAGDEDEDPLLHSYDLLSCMRQADLPSRPQSDRQTQQQQQQQQGGAAGRAQAAAAAGVAGAAPAARQQQQQQQHWRRQLDEGGALAEEEVEGGDEAEEVVLDDDDEEEEEEEEQEEEVEEGVGHCGAAGSSSEAVPSAEGGLWRQQSAAAPAPAHEQRQEQQRAGAGGGILGKRRAAEQLQGQAAGGSQRLAAAADENRATGSGQHGAPLLASAGPGRLAMQRAPGPSFIRNAAAASTGIERGKYISSGPDGRGGVATAYQSGGSALRLSQKQIDLGSLQSAVGGNKKARGGGGGGAANASKEAAAAQALRRNNALPITSFFSRVPQQ